MEEAKAAADWAVVVPEARRRVVLKEVEREVAAWAVGRWAEERSDLVANKEGATGPNTRRRILQNVRQYPVGCCNRCWVLPGKQLLKRPLTFLTTRSQCMQEQASHCESN